MMHFLRKKIGQLKIGWNERPLTEADFYALCRRHRVTVAEYSMAVSGFYYCVMGGHYIAVDSKLPPKKKLLVLLHEFAHFLMHVPSTNTTANFHGMGQKTRDENEADMFALVALIPKRWLETRRPEELIEDEGVEPDWLRDRLSILEKYGI
jgi:Zn-dependent peptidase ImmA (M78 family)